MLVTACAGALGYFLKSWISRSKPFVRVVVVNGGFTRKHQSGDSNVNNGALWIGFPGEGVAFGEQLNDFPLFRDRLRAFAQLVERVEYDKGNDVLGKARQIIQEI